MISNEIYENALYNKHNSLIMHKASVSFLSLLDNDEIYRCHLMALWKTLKFWDISGGRKFTSSLYQYVKWECLKTLKFKRENKNINIENVDQEVLPNTHVDEILECLSPELRNIVKKRYLHGMTLVEIGNECNVCHETIRNRLKEASSRIKKILK